MIKKNVDNCGKITFIYSKKYYLNVYVQFSFKPLPNTTKLYYYRHLSHITASTYYLFLTTN